MKADDQVFPIPYGTGVAVVGLSTRDHIAIEAMNGELASQGFETTWNESHAKKLCRRCYAFADAMIEESNK